MRKLVIKIEELPVRGRKLSASDYSNIFGGECRGEGLYCDGKLVCCPGYRCVYQPQMSLFAPVTLCV